jgi:hypothetical protein
MIDLYCERVGPGLWAEPLNALTNLAFLFAAWASWRLVRREAPGSRTLMTLVFIMAAIGVGSGLFHTFATPWSQALDIGPIIIFQLVFFWLYCRRMAALGPVTTSAIMAGVAAGSLVGYHFIKVVNGSLAYLPALVLLVCLGTFHLAKRMNSPYSLLAAAVFFLIALTFRTIDMAVCPSFPVGTHFLWHLSNSVVLYLGMKCLVLNWARVA